MARRKPPEEHENLERWLVSYADFITLLFAFFVVMYAISSINEGKYRVLSDSLVSAFKETPRSDKLIELTSKQGEILPGSGKPIGKMQQQPHGDADTPERKRAAESMKQVARNVLDVMQPLVRDGHVRVTQSPRGVTVEINASVLFKSGEAILQPQSTDTLAAVARVLAQVDNPVQVEGHTDNVPIRNPSFPSNWELSSARAGSVVRLFAEEGVPTMRMVAIGYADNRPIDTNATADGRGRNRRVNVLILNEVGGVTQEIALGLPLADSPAPASPSTVAPPAAR
ncbi:MAG: OmpA/MotB domain-containing protein [bacterium]|nr:MAG: OmpA/MotB domain-containing protein [bacterium]KAF0150250.1 MAG: OmpA/MotB domain-containing protein [bacterium]KAF0169730.1 MAG: OmpA/MotB domain-containing protein [bacterium]TXT21639.1 MAG: OmpA/MotB domain-containing protein [bacterium]